MSITSFEHNASLAEMAVELDRRGKVIEELEAKLAAQAEALESARKALEVVVASYRHHNPMRTGDMHKPECSCVRCAIDHADAALLSISQAKLEGDAGK